MTATTVESARAWLEREGLTSPSLIQLDYFAPPPELAPFITTFFLMRCDEPQIADIQPAGVGIFAVFLKGHGRMFVPDGHVDESHRANLVTPLAAAAPIVVEGPWHAFGAAISPLGWAALTGGLSAAQWGNRLVEAGELLGEDVHRLGEVLTLRYQRGDIAPDEMVAMTARAFGAILKHVPEQHVALIRLVAEWLGSSLSPLVEDLQEKSLYSPRQLQRLVDQYFGLTPKQLARKYRALRAAALLGNPSTTPEQIAHVEEQFYDQSHMIREIRLFAGRTPARLTAQDQPVLSAVLDLRNFRELKPQVAAMPPGLGEG